MDDVEAVTRYQMAHQPNVILMDHLVPNKQVHAVPFMGIVEVLPLFVNALIALIIEQVRLFKMSCQEKLKKTDVNVVNFYLILRGHSQTSFTRQSGCPNVNKCQQG